MKRTDDLRDRARENGERKNADWYELCRCRALLRHENEEVHNLKRARIIGQILAEYPIEIDARELLVGRIAVSALPADLQDELQAGSGTLKRAGLLSGASGSLTGHRVIDYETVLREGIAGILHRIGQKEGEISGTQARDSERKYFYQACRASLAGMLHFAQRFQEELTRRSEAEPDLLRKAEYQKLADIFAAVPLNPARDFYEAIQCVWFLQFTLRLVDDYSLNGRPDQYLYPYYAKGLQDGSLSRDFARELIESFYLKNNELYDSWPGSLIVGGVDPAGHPVYNELTELFIEAIAAARLVNPAVAICYNEHMPASLLEKCLDVLAQGHTQPAIFNDRVIISGLTGAGMRLEDARNYIHSTCVEMTAIGCSNIFVTTPYINTVKGLEYLLNEGRELTVQQDTIGSYNPQLRFGLGQFDSFAAFLDAYKQILAGMIARAVDCVNDRIYVMNRYASCPLTSCFTHDCIEKGLDTSAGGARYYFAYPCFPGFSSTVDSLNAIRETVFEKGALNLAEFREILRSDFSGQEAFRQYLLNRCPKYGNDLDRADELAVDLYDFIRDCLKPYRNCLGGSFHPSYFAHIVHGIFGEQTAATADGRRAGEALSECIGPVQGMDRQGPTAALNSIVKLDHQYGIGGIAANFRFSKSLLASEEGKKAVAGLIREYMRRGGFQIQINVVDQKTLLDARSNPEKYRNLLVRVAGFSAYFVNLSPIVQDEIIRRTEYEQL